MVDVKHEEPSVEVQNTEPLGRIAILGYGTGHMLNDITSACWFTYLLLFLTDIGLSPRLTDLDILSFGMPGVLFWLRFHSLLFLVVVFLAKLWGIIHPHYKQLATAYLLQFSMWDGRLPKFHTCLW